MPLVKMKLAPKFWSWSSRPPHKSGLETSRDDLPVIWQVTLTEDPGVQARLRSYLSEEELARMERLRQPADQQRFVTGRGVLRILAGVHLEVTPNQVELAYGPQGKPFLKSHGNQPSLRFNVSHSGNLVLLAFHPIHEVGVDVEEMRPNRDLDAIAHRTFSTDDHRAWLSLPLDQKPKAFFQLWARYEARVKVLGQGFGEQIGPAPASQIACHDLDLPDGYCGAVAVLTAV
jgi:4'-phosphopantetheinyl transferase